MDTVNAGNWPLAVDLDRTLLRTDSLVELFLLSFFRSPWEATKLLRHLRTGKACFKEALVSSGAIDPYSFLFNEELVDYLRKQHERGRPIHLVTAADQRLADAVAEKIECFSSATGSTKGVNLKGANKLKHLEEQFPQGFSYAGDSSSDLIIWERSRSAVLVGLRKSTRQAFHKLNCRVEFEIAKQPPRLRDWMRLFRIHQWSKNILIFVPMVLSQEFSDLSVILSVLVGFIAMGLAASGTYVINDISDIASDRVHPTKRFRPIASGKIDAAHALAVALLMILGGLALVASQTLVAAGYLCAYLLLTTLYSFSLKTLPIADIFVLAGLYTLRIVIGVFLAGAMASHWLLMFSFFFFFALSMAKRHVEIVNVASKARSVQTIKGRGYKTSDAPLTLAMGVGTNMIAILILSIYVASDIYPRALYGHPQWLWGVVILVMMWSSRIWLLSHRGELDDDPVSFALRDRFSLLIGIVTAVFFVLSVI